MSLPIHCHRKILYR